jgi:hypothetical protein
MPEFPNPKGSPNAFQRMQNKAKTLFRRKKAPMPKILELVGKSNVIGMVRHGNQTLVIYDGKGFSSDWHFRCLTLTRIWLLHRRRRQARQSTLLCFLGLPSQDVRASWFPPFTILAGVHRGPQRRHGRTHSSHKRRCADPMLRFEG